MPDPLSNVATIAAAWQATVGAIVPYLEEGQAQKYENEHRKRIHELEAVLASGDPDRMHAYFTELCNDAGTPAGELGENIRVPVGYLIALATIASENIKQDRILARVRFKMGVA